MYINAFSVFLCIQDPHNKQEWKSLSLSTPLFAKFVCACVRACAMYSLFLIIVGIFVVIVQRASL